MDEMLQSPGLKCERQPGVPAARISLRFLQAIGLIQRLS